MFVARYNPVLPTAAALVVLTSTNKIMRMMTAPTYKPWLLGFQAVILVLAAIALVMMLVRKHVVATEDMVLIRESCMRNPKEIKIGEMKEGRWGVKESGVWTKGKQQFVVTMLSGTEVEFPSLSWLPRKKRAQFFDYLRGRGVKITEQV